MVTKIKVKKLHPEAVMPKRACEGDAGYDLTAVSMEVERLTLQGRRPHGSDNLHGPPKHVFGADGRAFRHCKGERRIRLYWSIIHGKHTQSKKTMSERLSIKLNLMRLNKVGVTSLKGRSGNEVKCLVIPIEENKLFVGEKGIYLDLSAFKTKEGNRYLIKKSISKDDYNAMSEEERNSQPIVGGVEIYAPEPPQGEVYEQSPAATQQQPMADQEDNDLPF